MNELKHTSRGFPFVEASDLYGHKFTIQKSSLASEDAIWFGVESAAPRIMASKAAAHGVSTTETCGWVPYPIPDAVFLSTRMHLSREQVADLLPVLQQFVDTGEVASAAPVAEARPVAWAVFADNGNVRIWFGDHKAAVRWAGDRDILADKLVPLYTTPVAQAPCKSCNAKQAQIDALMLEHCPAEMKPEQVATWGAHQRASIACSACYGTGYGVDGKPCGAGCRPPAAVGDSGKETLNSRIDEQIKLVETLRDARRDRRQNAVSVDVERRVEDRRKGSA